MGLAYLNDFILKMIEERFLGSAAERMVHVANLTRRIGGISLLNREILVSR